MGLNVAREVTFGAPFYREGRAGCSRFRLRDCLCIGHRRSRGSAEKSADAFDPHEPTPADPHRRQLAIVHHLIDFGDAKARQPSGVCNGNDFGFHDNLLGRHAQRRSVVSGTFGGRITAYRIVSKNRHDGVTFQTIDMVNFTAR